MRLESSEYLNGRLQREESVLSAIFTSRRASKQSRKRAKSAREKEYNEVQRDIPDVHPVIPEGTWDCAGQKGRAKSLFSWEPHSESYVCPGLAGPTGTRNRSINARRVKTSICNDTTVIH